MCDLCRKNPCDCRCPNAKQLEEKWKCAVCGEGILENEKHYKLGYWHICRDCIEIKGGE